MFHYVYLIQSINSPHHTYVGYTTNIQQRIKTHNSGGSPHTKKNKPWKIITCIVFKNKQKAIKFEQYLKTHSGRAFAKKRFL